MSSEEFERQKAVWDEYERESLGGKWCPHSGEPLTRNGEAGRDKMSCVVCDCFGFDPKDPRIGARS